METPETINLAANMDDDEAMKAARAVVDGFEADDDSRADWLDKHAHWIDLYQQNDQPDNPPWQGASEESLPLLAEACNQFHARALPALFPNNSVIKARATGQTDMASTKRAERVTKHLNWQLLSGDPRGLKGYKRDKDAMLASVALHGSFFTKTFYDPVYRRMRVQNVRAEDLVVPYGVGPRALEDVDRKTHVIWMSMARAKALASVGYFNAEPEPFADDDTPETTKAQEEAEGLNPDTAGRDRTFCKLLEQHCWQDLDGDGMPEPYIQTVCARSKKLLRCTTNYTVDPISKLRLPVEMFTHYCFMPNPDGFYGLGMGHLIGKMNTSVNKLLRMSTDAAELANIGNQSGFISDQLDIPGREVEFQLGKFSKVRVNGQDIRQGVYKFDFPGPSPTLEKIMAVIMARSDRLATVTEALTGQTDAVMQPTALMALIEQGLTQFTTVVMRLADTIGDELQKIALCNRLHLDATQYYAVLDIDGRAVPENIARADYADDMQIALLIDPRNVTDAQRLAKAQAEYQVVTTNPLIMNNPMALWNGTMRYLKALGVENPAEILPPLNLAAMQPPRVDDPMMENQMFIMPGAPAPQPFPDQDHAAHVMAHDGLLYDPEYGAALPPDRLALVQQHRQQHIALMYGQHEMGGTDGGIAVEAGGLGALADESGIPLAPESAFAQATASLGAAGPGVGPAGPGASAGPGATAGGPPGTGP